MNKITKFFIVPISCIFFLSACASGVKEADQDVQDIKPGEKSIIQPPSSKAPSQSKIQEKNI